MWSRHSGTWSIKSSLLTGSQQLLFHACFRGSSMKSCSRTSLSSLVFSLRITSTSSEESLHRGGGFLPQCERSELHHISPSSLPNWHFESCSSVSQIPKQMQKGGQCLWLYLVNVSHTVVKSLCLFTTSLIIYVFNCDVVLFLYLVLILPAACMTSRRCCTQIYSFETKTHWRCSVIAIMTVVIAVVHSSIEFYLNGAESQCNYIEAHTEVWEGEERRTTSGKDKVNHY